MTEGSSKCFCEQYKSCQENPEQQLSWGHNVVENREEFISGEKFIQLADIICRGTRVFVDSMGLKAEDINIGETTVTIPIDAVHLQCEYYQSLPKSM